MMTSIKEGAVSRSFWFLIIAHSPNRYLAAIILFSCALAQFIKSKSLSLTRLEMSLFVGFLVCQIVGFVSGLIHYSSVNNIFWSMFNFSLFVSAFVLCATVRESDIVSGLKMFVLIEACVLMLQYGILMIKYKTLFVFSAFSGAGDFMSGTLFGFSSPMAVSLMMASAFFIFRYLDGDRKNENLIYSVAAALFSTFPGMMSGVAVLVVAILLTLAFFSVKEISLMKMSKLNLLTMPLILIIFAALALFLGDNIKYMENIFSLMIAFANPPIKILVIQKYLEMIGSESYFYLGAGLGNYTSRAAAMVSGQYFENQPFFIPITPSTEMLRYVLPFWNRGMFGEIVGGSIGNSMINEPFNGNLSMLAECGVVGYAAWLVAIFYSLIKAVLCSNRSLFCVLVFMFGILFTNDWFAYASFSMMFAVLIRASSISDYCVENQKYRGANEV